jgi:RNA 3'-terminal phosphate cyclase
MSAGSSVHAHAHFGNCTLGSGSLGEIGKKAEIVGEECAMMLKKQMESGACADEWMAVQLLPFMALAGELEDIRLQGYRPLQVKHCSHRKVLPVKFCVSENVYQLLDYDMLCFFLCALLCHHDFSTPFANFASLRRS